MVRRFPPLTLIVLLCALLGAALVLGALPAVGANPIALSCPNGATVWLEGQAPPNEALLAYLSKRSVGGGVADRAGRYRIPLRLRERPGIYPVEVRLRSSGAVVGSYECYVDVPLTNQPTLTPEIVVSAEPGATATPEAATAVTEPAGATATPTGTSATATTPTSTTPTSTTPTVTGTVDPEDDQTGTEDITIIEVIPSEDGDDPGGEYIAMFKNVEEAIDIGGWRVINVSRTDRPFYIFPSFVVDEDNLIYLYTDEGVRDPDISDFYWGLEESVWSVGDVAELRDDSNRLIHTYTVIPPSGGN